MTTGHLTDPTEEDTPEGGAPRRTKVGPWKPKPCLGCRTNVVAWTTPRVDYCYQCLPGGPFPPPPCRRCGGTADTGDDYYSQGCASVATGPHPNTSNNAATASPGA